jgi:TonB-dependent starch-binding outer membrane protein SusC
MRGHGFPCTVLGIPLTVLLIIFTTAGLHAQLRPSVVRGKVIDSRDKPVAGVSVIVRNTKTNFAAGTSTDSAGFFTFLRVSSGGPYSFTFSNAGYQSQTLSGYTIKEDIILSVVVRLKELIMNSGGSNRLF